MDKKVSYSTITRRVLAFIVDCILLIVIPFVLMAVGFSLTHAMQGIIGAIIIITTIVFSLFLMIPCIFHIFMLVKFGGTPGHLLFSMRVRDKDTFEQITLIQVIKRTIAFFIIYCIPLYNPILLLAILILVLVCTVDDKHKQAFHDKIANTVVIDYKPEN
ncbi:RDD family protein [Candidatus Wolbachia massiliensis]|uniref:RDD family protein n=1 Tax=Candidatus Wolbachia massiliensis TaxID=1845000 RepID=A0A7M3U2Z7_9RICK|nr:RDD family protein [Candidatus Wolbachia massiliensis]QOD38782.1 RDD family protein [Candidatus Wolbachia massiliensis]